MVIFSISVSKVLQKVFTKMSNDSQKVFRTLLDSVFRRYNFKINSQYFHIPFILGSPVVDLHTHQDVPDTVGGKVSGIFSPQIFGNYCATIVTSVASQVSVM